MVALGAGGLPAGRVRVGQTVVGALILMMVFNYMTIRGVPGTWQTTATGFLLLAAMVAGRLLQRGEGAESLGEAFRDEFASSRTAPLLAHGHRRGDAASCARLCPVNPSFAPLANAITLVEQNAALAIVAVGL